MPTDGVAVGDLAGLVAGSVRGDGAATVVDVHHDSREVTPGSMFVAIVGSATDGHDHVAGVADTAAAVCVERFVDVDLPQLLVTDTRAALGPLADAVHGHPSRTLSVVGITGTNGKTTVSYLVESIAQAAGRRTGVVGTIGASIGGDRLATARTTPEASDLHRMLATMARAGVELAAIEVSSHAMRYGRVDGVSFAVGAFTNLSRDHLDFHRDMDDYFAAKASLFTADRIRHAVVNTADARGRQLEALVAGEGVPVTTVLGPGAAIMARDVESGIAQSRFELVTPHGTIDVMVPMAGRFNVDNAVIAAACALTVGLELDDVRRGLAAVSPVPGRAEAVDAGQPFAVLVDYAHSPDAVEAVVEDIARLTPGRTIVVVGAGGDRDRDKRPLMGRAAARRADVVVVTSDNPRSEDPAAIAAAVAAGAQRERAEVVEIHDRREAIRHAISRAGDGDTVLVLGKGHEQGQDIGGVITPFDDRVVAREALERS